MRSFLLALCVVLCAVASVSAGPSTLVLVEDLNTANTHSDFLSSLRGTSATLPLPCTALCLMSSHSPSFFPLYPSFVHPTQTVDMR
jgi:hypothetical protein